jgi:hypothetical protein
MFHLKGAEHPREPGLANVCVVVTVSSDSSSWRWLAKAASIVSNAVESAGMSARTERSEPDPAALAHKQRRTQALFETFDLIGNGGLGHAELRRPRP